MMSVRLEWARLISCHKVAMNMIFLINDWERVYGYVATETERWAMPGALLSPPPEHLSYLILSGCMQGDGGGNEERRKWGGWSGWP